MERELEALMPTIEADTAARLAALETDVAAVRAARAKAAEATQRTGAQVALQEDTLATAPGGQPVPVRVFIPEGRVAGAYLHLHGGGWVLGSEQGQDPMLRALCHRAGIAVVSVGYRLAPEHPFPAGLDDCATAAHWLFESYRHLGLGTHDRIAIGGESAGANLAAALLLRRRDAGDLPFRAAVLTYGVFSAALDLPSMRSMWDRKLVLSGPIMEYFVRSYRGGAELDVRQPALSPLYGELANLPPALFSVGTLDHLYSDTIQMAAAWEKAGNACELHEYEDGPHGFTMFPQLAMARLANDRIIAFIRQHVGREPAPLRQ